jgi:two-component system response regulator AtoC
VAASNRDLKQMVAEGTFRDDLFYRLNVIRIHVPPLRERREDIPQLIDHFLERYNTAFGRHVQRLTPAALAILRRYHWPGNVRELENAIERLVAISPKSIPDVEDLPFDLLTTEQHKVVPDRMVRHHDLRQARAEFERHYILQVLEQCRWNQTEAAKVLGIHRNTLLGKMEMHHIRSTPDLDISTAADMR